MSDTAEPQLPEPPRQTPKNDPIPTGVDRVVGLVGPRGSGKTQFNVYLLNEQKPAPPYLNWLYRMPSYHPVEDGAEHRSAGARNAHLQVIVTHGQQRYQQRFVSTVFARDVDAQPIVVRFGDEESRKTLRVCILDFPGSEYLKITKDEKERDTRNRRMAVLQQLDDIVFIVPFWHLLPNRLFDSVLKTGAFVTEEIAQVPTLNDDMANDLTGEHGWFEAFQSLLAQHEIPRRFTLAISQFGGETLRRSRAALKEWIHLPKPMQEVVKSLRDLDDSTRALDSFSRSAKDRRGWLSKIPPLGGTARAVAYLEALSDAGFRFVESCADAGNESAQGLLGFLTHWESDVVTFNVIDGKPVTLNFDGVSEQYFRQDPVNVYLVVLAFWQHALQTLTW